MNLIKRKISVAKVPRTSSLTVETFYIIWRRDNREYFLCDASEKLDQALWSVDKHGAVSFTDGSDAMDLIREIHAARPKREGIIELKIISEEADTPYGGDYAWAV